MSLDKRGHRRFATQQKAAITIAGQPMIGCSVVDLSVNGASLDIGEHVVPNHFKLQIDSDVYHADVQWRRGSIIGVKLIAA